jgi:hypothetical protein
MGHMSSLVEISSQSQPMMFLAQRSASALPIRVFLEIASLAISS